MYSIIKKDGLHIVDEERGVDDVIVLSSLARLKYQTIKEAMGLAYIDRTKENIRNALISGQLLFNTDGEINKNISYWLKHNDIILVWKTMHTKSSVEHHLYLRLYDLLIALN